MLHVLLPTLLWYILISFGVGTFLCYDRPPVTWFDNMLIGFFSILWPVILVFVIFGHSARWFALHVLDKLILRFSGRTETQDE